MNIKFLKEKPSKYNKMRTSESFAVCFALSFLANALLSPWIINIKE